MQPFTFTSSVRSTTSSGTSWNTPGMLIPALLKTAWRPPQRSTVSSVQARTWAGSDTSPATANAPSPISATTSRTASSSTSTHVTRAPSSANRIAVARPIPEPAPVTIVTLPASRSPILHLRPGAPAGPSVRAAAREVETADPRRLLLRRGRPRVPATRHVHRMEVGMAGSDTEQLHQLGYAQELRRGMRTFSNFAVSFTIISILSGCLTLFAFAMFTGGPAVMTIGWLVVGFFVTLVALGMGEVASSYPTAGGLYYWAAKLAPESGGNPAAWGWFVGWFNFVGQVAVTAGIDFGLAFFINAFLNIVWGVSTAPPVTILIFGIVLFIH